MGSPSYLDKIAWREGKPQHYSEPKLILDLSHWKQNSSSLPLPAETLGGSMEDLGETKDAKEEEKEETGDLFQEISRWVETTQSRLHSPSPSPSMERSSPSCYTSSPPLPLSPTDHPTLVFHMKEVVQQPSAEYEPDRLSFLSPFTSSSNTLPSIFPSSPTSPFSPQTVSPTSTPLVGLPGSHPLSSANTDSTESLPLKQKERLFDLDVFISQALKLCRQSKENANGKKGQDGMWMEESKRSNIKVPGLPGHRTPPPSQTPNS